MKPFLMAPNHDLVVSYYIASNLLLRSAIVQFFFSESSYMEPQDMESGDPTPKEVH